MVVQAVALCKCPAVIDLQPCPSCVFNIPRIWRRKFPVSFSTKKRCASCPFPQWFYFLVRIFHWSIFRRTLIIGISSFSGIVWLFRKSYAGGKPLHKVVSSLAAGVERALSTIADAKKIRTPADWCPAFDAGGYVGQPVSTVNGSRRVLRKRTNEICAVIGPKILEGLTDILNAAGDGLEQDDRVPGSTWRF